MGLVAGLASLLTSPCEAEAGSRQDRARVPAQYTHISVQAQHMTAKVPCHRDPSLGTEPVPPPTSREPYLLPLEAARSISRKKKVEEARSPGDPTEVEHHSDLRGLRTHPAFPGGGAGSPLVLTGGLCGEGVGDGDGDEEKDRDLGNKESVRKKSAA